MSYVSKSARLSLYKDIPKEAYQFIADKMDWGNKWTLPTVFTNSISLARFEIIKEYFEEWKKDHAFSTSNQNGVFDLSQQTAYYAALTDFINSEEYILISQKHKRLIVEEHKLIFKRIYK